MGVRPEIPPKPDHLKNKHLTLVDEEEECEYHKPIQNHVYTELTEELTEDQITMQGSRNLHMNL